MLMCAVSEAVIHTAFQAKYMILLVWQMTVSAIPSIVSFRPRVFAERNWLTKPHPRVTYCDDSKQCPYMLLVEPNEAGQVAVHISSKDGQVTESGCVTKSDSPTNPHFSSSRLSAHRGAENLEFS